MHDVDVDPRGVVVELVAVSRAHGASQPSTAREPREAQSSTSASPITSGGSSRSVAGPGRVDHEPLLEQRAAHDRGRVDVEVEGDHQPAPADLRRRAAARATRSRSELAELAHAREQRLVEQHVERRERRGADDRPAGEGRAVVARRERVGVARAGDQRADREAAAERLRACISRSGTTPACS